MECRSTPELATLPILPARARLVDVVHEALRDAIAGGSLGPGTRLRETALARHYGVSATPVREALRRLERDGLVTVHPHRGAMVATFSPREIANLYEIHEALQSQAVRRAAEASQHDYRQIDELLAKMERVLDEPDQLAFNRLDLAFHRALNELSGNAPLADLIEQVHRRILSQRIRLAVHLPDRPALSHRQHKEMLAAVRAGDADAAEAWTRAHIRSVCAAVLTALDIAERQGAA